MDYHPIRGEVEIYLLQNNRDKLQHDGLLGSYVFNGYLHRFVVIYSLVQKYSIKPRWFHGACVSFNINLFHAFLMI